MLGIEMAKRLALASFGFAVLGAAIAVFAPLITLCSSTSGGAEHCTGTSTFDHDGAWVIVAISVPVLLTLLPLLLRHRVLTVVSTVLLSTFCVLSLASIGLFFVPAAVLMTIAAARDERLTAPAHG